MLLKFAQNPFVLVAVKETFFNSKYRPLFTRLPGDDVTSQPDAVKQKKKSLTHHVKQDLGHDWIEA